MRKVTKILSGFISSVILAAIVLPLFVWLLLMLPSVQNFAAGKLADAASRMLGTRVSVERVDIRLPHTAVIRGFHVEDHNADTLLYAGRLSANISPAALLGGKLVFGYINISGAKFYIRENADGTTNLSRVLEKLKREKEPRERKKPFTMSISSFEIDDSAFGLRKNVVGDSQGVNFDDLEISSIYLSVGRLSLVDDSVAMRIDAVSLKEKSGFAVNLLSCGDANVSGSGIRIKDFRLDASGSVLNMDYLRLGYDSWKSYKDFVNSVTVEAAMTGSTLDSRTVACFVPKAREWNMTLDNIEAVFEGTVADMSGSISGLIGGKTSFAFAYGVRGMPDLGKSEFDVNVEHLSTDADGICSILAVAGKPPLNDTLAGRLGKLGNICVEGHFKGRLDRFTADALAATSIGEAAVDLEFVPEHGNATAFAGSARANGFDLGAFLGNPKLGKVSASADLDGTFSATGFRARTKAVVSDILFNDYLYTGIELAGTVDNKNFRGDITSADPNINFNFSGMVDFNDSIPSYDFGMRLYNADLAGLHFNSRDSISRLSCTVSAKGSGNSLDNLNGRLTIDDLLYINHIDSVETGSITLTGKNNTNNKYLAVNSDFTDIEFRSRMSYPRMLNYLTGTLRSYLPSLSADKSSAADTGADVSGAEAADYSMLSLNVKHTDNLAKIFLPGLVLAEGTKMNFMFNPVAEKFSLTLKSEYIEYGNSFISDLELNSTNRKDSISVFIRAGEAYAAGLMFPDLSVMGGVRDNSIYTSTRFNDGEKERSALINILATLGRNEETGAPQIVFRTSPSYVTTGGHTWNISARATADSSRIVVNNFRIGEAGQSLTVNGIVSGSRSDTLHAELRNFDLGILTQITERMGYNVAGKSNGHVDFVSLKRNGVMYANILFEDMKLNDVELPPALFESRWDFERERARFLLSRHGTADTLVSVLYRPSDGRYRGDVDLKNVDLSLLSPFFSGIMSGTSGSADVRVNLSGQKGALKLNGGTEVRRLDTTVDILNVPYSVENAVIELSDNVMKLESGSLKDPQGNRAKLGLRVDFNNIGNISYDIRVLPENLMVMNTTSYHNDMFYGKVFASGGAHIFGDKRGVSMDITAVTKGKSEFYMPLGEKSDIADADFIRFVSPRRERTEETSEYLQRRNTILGRNVRERRRRERAGDLNINMTLGITPDLLFQLLIDPQTGHSITGRGRGSLNLHINPRNDQFGMYGNCEIIEGTYNFSLENIIKKPFTIERGSMIQWTGDPLGALLDISALYRLKTSLSPIMQGAGKSGGAYNVRVPVDCRIMLRDKLSQPDIAFNITAPTADPETQSIISSALNTQESMATQFFFLLATGSFYTDSGTAYGNIGTAAGTSTAFDFLSNQISNWVSSDKFSLGIRYSPQSELASEEYGIDYSQALFSNRLFVEVEGNYNTGNTPTLRGNANNLTGDFYLTWLVDRPGSLKTKIFSRTIDRFDENQGLQETGLGIYYNENFNTVKDIVANFRERFSGWGRKRQREAQREADERERELLTKDDGKKNDDADQPVGEGNNNSAPAPTAGKPDAEVSTEEEILTDN